MNKPTYHNFKPWIDHAKEDLQTSNILFENKKYKIAFQHFHQAIEKSYKAYIQLEGDMTEKELKQISHYPIKQIKDNLISRISEMDNMKSVAGEKLKLFTDFIQIQEHSENLNNSVDKIEIITKSGSNNIPIESLQAEIEYYKEGLEFIESGAKIEASFKDFKEKMIDMGIRIKELNPEKGDEFIELANDNKTLQQLMDYSFNDYFPNVLKLSFAEGVIGFGALITYGHYEQTKYPTKNSIEFTYDMTLPIIEKLPEFSYLLEKSIEILEHFHDIYIKSNYR